MEYKPIIAAAGDKVNSHPDPADIYAGRRAEKGGNKMDSTTEKKRTRKKSKAGWLVLLAVLLLLGCRSAFYDDLIEHLIDIFGPSTNTRKLCDYLFKRAGKRFIDEATVRLNKYEADHRFQPEM